MKAGGSISLTTDDLRLNAKNFRLLKNFLLLSFLKMKELVQNFTAQLREAKAIADKAIISPGKNIQNIVISGLGGSGIGGTIIAELVSAGCPVPININKDY